MMKIKITREDGSLHSFDFYKKERCVFSISENGDMYYSIWGRLVIKRFAQHFRANLFSIN